MIIDARTGERADLTQSIVNPQYGFAMWKHPKEFAGGATEYGVLGDWTFTTRFRDGYVKTAECACGSECSWRGLRVHLRKNVVCRWKRARAYVDDHLRMREVSFAYQNSRRELIRILERLPETFVLAPAKWQGRSVRREVNMAVWGRPSIVEAINMTPCAFYDGQAVQPFVLEKRIRLMTQFLPILARNKTIQSAYTVALKVGDAQLEASFNDMLNDLIWMDMNG